MSESEELHLDRNYKKGNNESEPKKSGEELSRQTKNDTVNSPPPSSIPSATKKPPIILPDSDTSTKSKS